MNLMAKTLILLSLNVLVFKVIAKSNTSAAYFLAPPPNVDPFICYDVRQYDKLNHRVTRCMETRWSPNTGQGGILYLNEKDCCFLRQRTEYLNNMTRRECEVTEPEFTNYEKHQYNEHEKTCFEKLGISSVESRCLSLQKALLNPYCDQFLIEITNPVVTTTTTPSPISTTTGKASMEKHSKGSADKLREIPILLSTLLLICFYI